MSKRIRFLKIHFGLSVLIGGILTLWFFFIGYSIPLAKALGAIQILLLVIVIDIIIGPILCFIIYRENKKSLKFDLSLIIFLQISAFTFGSYNLIQGRPAWIVYNQGNFDVVQRVELVTDELSKATNEFKTIPILGPKFAAVKTRSFNEINHEEKAKSISFIQQPEKYIKLNVEKENILKNSKPLDELNKYNDKKDIEKIKQQYPSAEAWLPLRSTTYNMVVLINKDPLQVVKVVDLNPW